MVGSKMLGQRFFAPLSGRCGQEWVGKFGIFPVLALVSSRPLGGEDPVWELNLTTPVGRAEPSLGSVSHPSWVRVSFPTLALGTRLSNCMDVPPWPHPFVPSEARSKEHHGCAAFVAMFAVQCRVARWHFGLFPGAGAVLGMRRWAP